MLEAEMPHAIWNANYCKKRSYPHLSIGLGKTDWHLPRIAAQTRLSRSASKSAAFPSAWHIFNKSEFPQTKQLLMETFWNQTSCLNTPP